jgi:LmbE family N-acetylglucosaminyl deacetylase
MSEPAGLLGRTLVLVAHPDDESAGCGALLQRMREPIVVFATDGSPRDAYFWGRYGSRLRYARVRQEEAQTALSLAGVSEIVFLAEANGTGDVFVDQELYRVIPEALAELTALVSRYRPEALLTMAYEGGHPDHDTCSFLGAVLGRWLGLPTWEFPLYHRPSSDSMCWQRFPPQNSAIAQSGDFAGAVAGHEQEMVLEITAEEAAIKRKMLSCYASQGPFLAEFGADRELFRRQHAYEYSQPPHAGPLNYEAWQWPMTGNDVCAALAGFLQTERQPADR